MTGRLQPVAGIHRIGAGSRSCSGPAPRDATMSSKVCFPMWGAVVIPVDWG